MANVKGLVVQIGGDTSGLDKAIKSASKGASALQKELNEINKALKLDPSSTTLLAQKQQVLSNKIKDTTNLLKSLKEEQARYIREGGDLNTAEYRKLERQIAQTTQELKQLNYENSKWKEASDNLQKFSDKMAKIGSKITEIGQNLTKYVTTPIAGLVTAGVTLNADLEKNTKLFEVLTGSTEEAQQAIANIRKDAQSSIFSSKDLIKANTYLLNAGLSAEEAREDINLLANVLATTGDSYALQNMAYNLAQVEGNLKASAVDMKQFNNAQIPVWDLLLASTGKSRAELEKTGVTFEMLIDALKKASEEGGKYEGMMEQMANTTSGKLARMRSKLEESLMGLTESIMPLIEKVVDKITSLIDRFNALSPETKETILNVMLALASLGPIVTILGKVITAVGTIAGWLSKLSSLLGELSASATASGTSLSAIAGPIGIVIGVIAGLTAEFVHLFKTNEEFNAKVMETWQNIVNFFNEYVKPIWEQIVTLVKNVFGTIWDIIKSVWGQIEPYIAEAFTTIMDWWNTTGSEMLATLMVILKKLLEGVNWLWVNVIDPIIKYYMENLKPAIEFFANFVSATIKFLLQTISDWWNMVKGIFNGIITFLTGVFTGDWSKAWQGIKDIFASIVNGLVNVFKTPLNYIIDLINGFIRGINKIKMPDWVPRIGRNEF